MNDLLEFITLMYFREFGDYHTTAIDETWYKMAIMQHEIDPDSFVYSVPHADDPLEDAELQVTASHAIFSRDKNLEAPGSVVGFKFSHARMLASLMNITAEIEVNLLSFRISGKHLWVL